MPTTVTGLLIFIALLAPGFAFLIVVERGPRAQVERSVLRETATIVLASLSVNALVAALFTLVRKCCPANTPDPGALLVGGRAYVADHLSLVSTWSLILFSSALGLAVVAGGVLNRPAVVNWLRRSKVTTWLFPEDGTRFVSAWWKVLKTEAPQAYRRLSCGLDDGTNIEGWLLSFNPSANETTDRELALSAPLMITRADGTRIEEKYGAITLHASRIQYLYVDYRTTPPA